MLNVCGSFPLFMHPTRASISQILFRKPHYELPFCVWAILTGSIFGASWVIGMVVKTLETMLAFAGGTTGMLIGFSLPGAFYYQLHRQLPVHTDDLSDGNVSLQLQVISPRSGLPIEGARVSSTVAVRRRGMQMGALLLSVVTILLIPVLLAAQIIKMSS